MRKLRGKGRFSSTGGRAEGRPVIAVDTSSLIAFLEGSSCEDYRCSMGLGKTAVYMVPFAHGALKCTRLLRMIAVNISEVPLIEVASGYWNGLGALRDIWCSQKRGQARSRAMR